MTFISFLFSGPTAPQLEDLQLDNRIKQCVITCVEDTRTESEISSDALWVSVSPSDLEISLNKREVPPTTLIKVDFDSVEKAREVWLSFRRKVSYMKLMATTGILGLAVLGLKKILIDKSVTKRFIFGALAVGILSIAALSFARRKLAQISTQLKNFNGFHFQIVDYAQKISDFRKYAFTINGQAGVGELGILKDRALEFFTVREQEVCQFVLTGDILRRTSAS